MHTVFISHAREDKNAIARPLAEELQRLGMDVWYDEFSLDLGDSLKQKIDEGLSRCDYGAVILSRQFFQKRWTREELDGLVAREVAEKRKIILPIWHNITFHAIARFSPTLAGKFAIATDGGVEKVAQSIARAISGDMLRALAKIDESLEELKRQIREGEMESLFILRNKDSYFMALAHDLMQPRHNLNLEQIIQLLEAKLAMTRVDTQKPG